MDNVKSRRPNIVSCPLGYAPGQEKYISTPVVLRTYPLPRRVGLLEREEKLISVRPMGRERVWGSRSDSSTTIKT